MDAVEPGRRGDTVVPLPVADRQGRGLAAEPERGSHTVAHDAMVYSVGVYIAQAMLFGAGLLQKALLGPTGTGYWALMSTFFAFFGVASFGVFHAAWREVPSHRGRGDLAGAAAVADTAGTASVAAVAAAGTVLVAVALLAGDGWAPELRWGLVLLGASAPLRIFVDVHDMLLQVTKRFSTLSTTVVLRAVATLTAQTLLVLLAGFYGMFAGVVAVALGSLAYWARRGLIGWRRPAFHWRLDRKRLRSLAMVGVPIMLYSQVWVLFTSIDNLIVARFIDVRALGFYALAVSTTYYVMLLPNTIATALFPRMQERFGATQDPRSIRGYVVDTQLFVALVVAPVLVAAAFFLVPLLIRHALPAFTPAIPVVHVMVAGSFAMALVYMPLESLLTTGRRWAAFTIILAALMLNAVANYVAVSVLDEGIRGAAYATSATYLVLLSASTPYALRSFLDNWRLAQHVGVLLAALAVTGILLVGIERLRPAGGSLAADAASSLGSLALFLIMFGPVAVVAGRRYGRHGIAAQVRYAWSAASPLFAWLSRGR